jgi:hypothetical protein
MEYIILLLLVVIVGILFFKNPSQLQNKLIDATVKELRDREADIVLGAYNKLPKEIKDKVDSKMYAEIISFGLNVTLEIIEDELKQK